MNTKGSTIKSRIEIWSLLEATSRSQSSPNVGSMSFGCTRSIGSSSAFRLQVNTLRNSAKLEAVITTPFSRVWPPFSEPPVGRAADSIALALSTFLLLFLSKDVH